MNEQFPQPENTLETPQVKEGVDFVFNQSPELATIGTPEQYSEYLETVFPESKLKDIVYHGTKGDFETFDKNMLGTNATLVDLSQKGFFFSDNLRVAKFYGTPKAYLINIENPVVIDDDNNGNTIGVALEYIDRALKNTEDADSVIAKGFKDSVVEDEEAKDTGTFSVKQNQLIVFEPQQIYTLGSKKDIENFQEFVNGK